MYYYPCNGCANDRSACERLAEIKNAVKGLNVTSIKFRCDIRAPMFTTGQRVSVTLPFYVNQDIHGECDELVVRLLGTVICENLLRRSYFRVRLDDGQRVEDTEDPDLRTPQCLKSGTGYVRVHSRFITPVDEPEWTVCGECEGVGGVHVSYCSSFSKGASDE